jgi:CBS domain containing-hemolysin-like protein
MTILIIACAITLLVSFFCSLSEAVLYSLPRAAAEAMAKEGKRAGILFRRFKQDIEKPITAILTVNTVANTAGAAIAGAAFVGTFGSKWLWAFTAAITIAILLFSEIFPKTIGVTFHHRLSKFTAVPINLLIILTSPITLIIQLFVKLFMPVKKKNSSLQSTQEIVSLANLHRKEGAISAMEEKIIENVLGLKDKKAVDIMTPRTVVLSMESSLTVEEARAEAGEWTHSRVPVFGKTKDDILGLVFRRDVHSAILNGEKTKTLDKIMHPIHIVPEMVRSDRLLHMFLERREHLFAVVDEYGGFSGVVTLEDVLEEMIGRQIIGEFDKTVDMSEMARRKGRRLFSFLAKSGQNKT